MAEFAEQLTSLDSTQAVNMEASISVKENELSYSDAHENAQSNHATPLASPDLKRGERSFDINDITKCKTTLQFKVSKSNTEYEKKDICADLISGTYASQPFHRKYLLWII